MIRWFLILTCFWASCVQAQDDERGFIQGMLESALSGDGHTVSMQGFAGALSSKATIDEITIADDKGVWLSLKGVAMAWHRAALLSGRIEVQELSAEKITLARLPKADTTPSVADSEAKEFSLPELPVSVLIEKLTANKLDIASEVAGQAAQFSVDGAFSLASGSGKADLKIKRQDKEGRFFIAVGFDNETRQLSADIELREGKDGFLGSILDLPDRPSIDLTFKGDAPLDDFAGQMFLETNSEERVSGNLTIASIPAETGDTQPMRIGIDLTGDVAPLVPDDYRKFFGDESTLRADVVTYGGAQLDIENLTVKSAALALDGNIYINENGLPSRFDLNGHLAQGDRVQLPLSGEPVLVSKADFSAKYDSTVGENWTVTFAAKNLQRGDVLLEHIGLDGAGVIVPTGTQEFHGGIDFQITGFQHADETVKQAIGSDLSGHVDLDWSAGKPFEIENFTVVGAGISAYLQGALGKITEGLPFTGKASVQADDISRFSALAKRPLSGAAVLTVAGEIQLLSNIMDVQLDAKTTDLRIGETYVDRLLAGQGQVSLNLLRNSSGTWVSPLHLESPAGSADLRGALNSKAGQFTIKANLNELSEIEPRISGPGQFTMRADWNKGEDIRIHGFSLVLDETELGGQGRLWPEKENQPVEGYLGLKTPDLARFSGLAGLPLAGQVDLVVDGNATLGDQNFDVRGSIRGRDIRTGIPDLDKLLQGALTVRAGVSGNPNQMNFQRLTLETPQLNAQADGALGGNETLALSARLADLGLFVSDFNGPVTAAGTLQTLSLATDQMALDMDMQGPDGVGAQITGQVLQFGKQLALNVAGQAPLGVANQFISPRSVNGLAQFNLDIDGPPALDSVRGEIKTENARLSLPALKISVEDIVANVTLNGPQAQLQVKGDFPHGGNIDISGPIALTTPHDADLKIRLNKIKLKDPELYETSLKGKLQITGPLASGGRISGKIKLPKTELRVPSAKITSLGNIPDINHIHEGTASQQSRKRSGLIKTEKEVQGNDGPVFDLDINISASNEIFIRGRGLDAELGGKVHIGGTTADIIPSGQFQLIRGRLDILSKRLSLEEGSIALQGDFNPYLRLVAESEAENTILQVIIEGLLSSPEIKFESQPSLPEEEVVALLIFGRGLENLSAFQAVRLAAAVASLAGKNDGDALSGLRNATGLSDLDVNTNEEGNAELTAGFYISDRVYSEVSVDDQGKSELNINYDVSKSVTVKGIARSDGNSGLGIFFEKDY